MDFNTDSMTGVMTEIVTKSSLGNHPCARLYAGTFQL